MLTSTVEDLKYVFQGVELTPEEADRIIRFVRSRVRVTPPGHQTPTSVTFTSKEDTDG